MKQRITVTFEIVRGKPDVVSVNHKKLSPTAARKFVGRMGRRTKEKQTA